ncbi:aminoacyl-tRNA hydrolase [Buchnera aphidicola]|uniref:aminoacyl-tRNA hydrolase n=1 Tax=Buchnera aphidicola TaxID=9 RepID=UPI00346454C0
MIVGLANPNNLYCKTRHNIGSVYIYLLANHYKLKLKEEKKFFGYTENIYLNNEIVRLLVPNIFMNINGKSVFLMSSFYNINLDQILIIHDDLDLIPGVIKIKYGFGTNGHKGLKNIISYFKNGVSFYRIRIGIGRPNQLGEIPNYVLSIPNKYELNLIYQSMKKTIFFIENFIREPNLKNFSN